MALRHLAGRIGVPALRRASGSRLAQPAPAPAGAPRRPSSSLHQGGHDNGAKKPVKDADVARRKAKFAAECEAIREAMKKSEANSRLLMRCCAAGLGVWLITTWHTTYVEMQRSKHFRAMLE